MDITRQPPNLLPMPASPSDFDLNAFLQDDGLGFVDEAYSSATLSDSGRTQQTTSPINTATGQSSSSSDLVQSTPLSQAQSQKQRLERRGHTKSRRGCFNCKRRRIKCQETRPACGHCQKTGLKCEYPTTPQIVHQPHHQIPLFSLQDMRFFQHFLMSCYPHHPIGNEQIWTHEVPCLSQTNEYLMHAILGLAACDLSEKDPSLMRFAVAHRMKAIQAIKKALGEMPKRETTSEEANALIATCFALTFQSVSFDDGMAEYMAFIRGVIIVGMQMCMKGLRPMFLNLLGDDSREVLRPYMSDLPLIEREWTDGAVASIVNLRPLCRCDVEIEYHEKLLEMAQPLYTSSWDAYKGLQSQYAWWIMLPHDKFQRLIDLSNQTAVLLGAHWIALKMIMARITSHEGDAAQKKPPPTDGTELGMTRWLKFLNGRVDAAHEVYNAWPMWVQERLEFDIEFFGKRHL